MSQRSVLSRLLTAVLVSVAYVAAAQAPQVAPGEYLAEKGGGTLQVATGGHFTLETRGANGSSCDLEGDIRNGRAQIETNTPDESCALAFVTLDDAIEVQADGRGELGCRFFCGARAYFEGKYLHPAPGCMNAARVAARRKFKTLYAAKSYAQAAAALSPLLSQCVATLEEFEDAQIRNDLAIAQFHLKQYSECLQTLAPILEQASKTDQELAQSLPPAEYDGYLPIARATRFNAKLCKQQSQ
jgi:hypothetical protein